MDENLIKAAELVENNWTKGSYKSDDSYCMDGALREITLRSALAVYYLSPSPASELSVPYVEALTRLLEVLPTKGECCKEWVGNDRVHHYNDEHCDGGVTASKLMREAAEVEL